MTAQEKDQEPNEWDYLADQYNLIFKPKLQPLYDQMANEIISTNFKLMVDFGCGVGEPSHTILKQAKQGRVIATDGSIEMLKY